MYTKAALVLGLLPQLLAARSVGNVRRGVDCSYSATPSSDDTCDSFASSWGMSTTDLKNLNPGLDCGSFDTGKAYCVIGEVTNDPEPTTTVAPTPTTTKQPEPTDDGHSPHQSGIAEDCDKYHKVVSGDSCDKIEKDNQISHAQFSKWNPAINDECSNLLLGFYVCTHVPGAVTNPPDDGHSPHQEGIAENCDEYHKIVSGDTCDKIEKDNQISHAQFSKWNPAINDECSNLLLGFYVCTHVPGAVTNPPDDGHSPHQEGIAENCDKYHKVVSGDQCDKIEKTYEINHTQFSKWNPAINDSCTNLLVGYYVCVHIPGAVLHPVTGPQPQLPDTNPNCKKYHKVASGQGCYDIDQQYGITFSQLRRWNPSINDSCTNLPAGYYVCVGV